jgi:alpha-L-fucosidase
MLCVIVAQRNYERRKQQMETKSVKTIVAHFADITAVETLFLCTVQLKCDGTLLRTGGEVKGKLANGVGSQ